jgi:hypothetical protein
VWLVIQRDFSLYGRVNIALKSSTVFGGQFARIISDDLSGSKSKAFERLPICSRRPEPGAKLAAVANATTSMNTLLVVGMALLLPVSKTRVLSTGSVRKPAGCRHQYKPALCRAKL